MNTNSHQNTELPVWLWLVFPPMLLIAQVCVRIFDIEQISAVLGGEGGIVENVTVIILIPSVILGAIITKNSSHLPGAWLRTWFLLLTLAALYFAGEEASWGQHWFGWATPEVFRAVNDQGETNFHNMTSWLDQKPRLIVELSVLIGGVIIPVYYKRKKRLLSALHWQFWFFPSIVCLPTAIIIAVIKLPDRIFGTANIPANFRLNVSETQEYYVALLFLLYFLSIYIRMKRN